MLTQTVNNHRLSGGKGLDGIRRKQRYHTTGNSRVVVINCLDVYGSLPFPTATASLLIMLR